MDQDFLNNFYDLEKPRRLSSENDKLTRGVEARLIQICETYVPEDKALSDLIIQNYRKKPLASKQLFWPFLFALVREGGGGVSLEKLEKAEAFKGNQGKEDCTLLYDDYLAALLQQPNQLHSFHMRKTLFEFFFKIITDAEGRYPESVENPQHQQLLTIYSFVKNEDTKCCNKIIRTVDKKNIFIKYLLREWGVLPEKWHQRFYRFLTKKIITVFGRRKFLIYRLRLFQFLVTVLLPLLFIISIFYMGLKLWTPDESTQKENIAFSKINRGIK